MLFLRPMTEADLPLVEAWLGLPHVARWWTPDTTAAEEIAKYRRRISPRERPVTIMLMVTWDGAGIGWCQWYRWADYRAEAVAMAARLTTGHSGIVTQAWSSPDTGRRCHGGGHCLATRVSTS